MVDTHPTRRRLLQTAGVAIGSSIVVGTASADHEETWTFHADLTGEGHGIETNASGRATFEIPPDDHRIHYTIDAEWLCYATQAHIHLGGEGEDGPVVAWLYPEEGQEPQTIEGRFDGTLAEGTFTGDDLVGPLEGADAGEIVSALIEGDAYVNVHTEEHPGGEIRGQIRPDDETAELIEAARDESGEVEEVEEGEDEEEGDDSEEQDEDSDNDDEEEGGDDEPEDEADGEGGSDDGEEDGDGGGEEDEPDDGEDEEEEQDEVATVAADADLALGEINVGQGVESDNEYITLHNEGDNAIDFTGWAMQDRRDDGMVDTPGGASAYSFPSGFTLEAGAQVRIYTGGDESDDSDNELHWGNGNQIWSQEGDTVIVEDANGDVALETSYNDQTSSIRGIFDSIRALFA